MFLLLPTCAAFAQEASLPRSLHLREAVRMALERNPGLKATRLTTTIAEANRLEASKRLNLAFSFTSENWQSRPWSHGRAVPR